MLLPAELAWYVTGRFYLDDKKTDNLADYGYFLHLAGVDQADLFAGKPGEGTAHVTFAAKPFSARGVPNGALNLSLDPVGEFSLYLQRTPVGTFDDPRSFAEGQRIATFRRTSLVVGTTVDDATGLALVASNVFSARLVDCVPFTLGGRRHDLAQVLPAGVTQFGTAAEAAITPVPKGYLKVTAFAGSAIALA
jgi:hypothetical protein